MMDVDLVLKADSFVTESETSSRLQTVLTTARGSEQPPFCVAPSISPTTMLSLAMTSLATVHPERAAMIEELTAMPLSWKVAAVPRFAEYAPGEALKPMMGVLGDWKKAIDDAKERGEIEEFQMDANLEVPECVRGLPIRAPKTEH